jgi:hypothetical protein
LGRGGGAVGAVGGRAWPADDRDGQLRAADGRQAAQRLGLRDAGQGGLGLVASAAVLSDRDQRAGARRIDDPQADAAARARDRGRDHPAGDRQGPARDQVPRARRQGRLDGHRGRHPLSVGCDAGAAGHAGAGARGRKLAELVKGATVKVRDRSRSVGRTVRQISKTLARRTGQAKQQVIELNSKAGTQIAKSAREARRLAAQARRAARGRGAKAKLHAAAGLEQLAERCEKIAEQISRRARGLKITDRLVSISDPDARPIRKGKLGKPTEFGYVAQIAEVTENTRRGARGFILPAATRPGNPAENTLLPDTIKELEGLGVRPRELVCDGGFQAGPTRDTMPENTSVFISGRHESGSRRTRKRQARYRTGIEGRISHLKRGYGLRRSRLKGHDGQQTWTGWGILTYNLDTLAIRTD